jgi:iron complex outermembrane receptor protein
MVFNRLGFFDRLVLYWPHIGLITQSTRGMGLMSTQRSTQRSTAIAAAVTLALSGQTAAVLAAQSTSAGSNQQIEEVVVTGIRGSLRESLETKRESVGVVDAISAEDVGKFPDKNLAEALQRVPGIVISRDFGEGERVNLRGLSSTLTRTLLNGHSLATADWFILDQLNTTRSFNYLMLPADVIGQVKVSKSPQADFEEGGIGGTIDVVTRKPLEMESMQAYLSGQMAYTDLADQYDPQFSGLFNWKNPEGTFGAMIAAIYQERNIRRDGVETLTYDTRTVNGQSGILVPGLIGSALFTQERVRKGVNFAVQFAAADNFDVTLEGLYSKFDADNTNENFLAWGSRAINNGGTISNATIEGGTAVAGTISSLNNGTGDFGVVYDAINRFAAAETRSIDADFNWQPADKWDLHFKVGYTDAEGNTDSQPFVEFGAPATFTYDLRGKSPQVHFANVDPTDPNDMQFIFSSLHQILNDDDETYGYVDATRELEWGVLDSVKFGAKYTDHNRDLRFNATTYGGFHVPINQTPASAFAGGPTPGDFLDEISAPGTLDAYWQINKDAVNSILFNNLTAPRVYYPQQSFSVSETATAGYVMGNLSGDKWRGNVGLRFVTTDQNSKGNEIGAAGCTPNPFGCFTPISVDRTYDDWLPQANFAFDLSDQFVLRAALARVMARPDYTDVAPRVSLNTTALSGTGGNPNIDPYRANQADVSIEWYNSQDAVVALAVYYKDIKSFITDEPGTEVFTIQAATAPSLACTPAGTLLFTCPFTINRRSNGGGGSVQGFEFTVTQPIAMGFGFTGNYTYSDADTDSGDPLPGNSKDTYNLSGYFENERLSARLSYTYRSDWFVTFDRNTPLNQDALESLDASVVVNVLDNVALTFDALNITDEKTKQFSGTELRPRAIYDNGRVYYAGVRLKF